MPIRRPPRPRPPLSIVLAVALWAGGAQAQSLSTLYEAARTYDAQTLSARAAAEAARYRLAQVEGRRLPNAALTGAVNRADSHTSAVGSVNSNTESLAVQGRQPLFNRVTDAEIEQARLGVDIARTELEFVEQDLIVRLAQAYFDVLAAQDTLSTAQTNKRAIAEQLASAKRNFEVGTATITDTREAQARHDLAGAQEIRAENDLRAARIALDVLVGRTGVEPRPLAAPARLPDVQPADAEEWVKAADAVHPQVNRLRLLQEIARLETRKSRAAELPTVDLVGAVSQSHASGAATSVATRGSATTASVGVQMNWTLFSGFQVQNRIKETLVLEEKARQDVETTRRTIAQQTRVAYFGTQSLKAQVAALEAAESSSQLALEATELGYRVGVRVNLDVLNAQTQLFQTRRDLAKARYDVIVNSLKLRQASGQLMPQDVAATDALLAR